MKQKTTDDEKQSAEKCEMLKTRARERSLGEENLQMIYGTCLGLRKTKRLQIP